MAESRSLTGSVRVGRCYINSPIVEAVCEFRFLPEPEWDLAIPGMLYDKIRDRFPKRRAKKQLSVGLTASGAQTESRIAANDIAQFYREDETALVQVGEHFLSVNQLKPYGAWDDYLAMIGDIYTAFREMVQLKGLARLGLRFINVIELASQNPPLHKYFKFYPQLGDSLPKEFHNFVTGIETYFENGRDLRRVTLAQAGVPSKETSSILLDIDYGLVHPNDVGIAQAIEWVKTAHDHVEATFEACITDELRSIFGEGGA